jgi:hypothetical protein
MTSSDLRWTPPTEWQATPNRDSVRCPARTEACLVVRTGPDAHDAQAHCRRTRKGALLNRTVSCSASQPILVVNTKSPGETKFSIQGHPGRRPRPLRQARWRSSMPRRSRLATYRHLARGGQPYSATMIPCPQPRTARSTCPTPATPVPSIGRCCSCATGNSPAPHHESRSQREAKAAIHVTITARAASPERAWAAIRRWPYSTGGATAGSGRIV